MSTLLLLLAVSPVHAEDPPRATQVIPLTAPAVSPVAAPAAVPMQATPPSAEPAPPLVVPPTGALQVDVYIDTSISNTDPQRRAHDLVLTSTLQAWLRDEDQLAVYTFAGAVVSLVPLGPAHAPHLDEAFAAVRYTDMATLNNAIWMHQADEHPTLKHVLVVVTDDASSDPLNLPSGMRDRPAIYDPSFKTAPPSVIGDAKVLWVVRDTKKLKKGAVAPPLSIVAGAVQARWTEPGGLSSTLVNWNPDPSWHSTDTTLTSWIDATRPEVMPVAPPEAPTQPLIDPETLRTGVTVVAKGVAGLVGLCLAGMGLVVARNRARQVVASTGTAFTTHIEKKKADQIIRDTLAAEAVLRFEPQELLADPVERRVRAGDEIEISALASHPGVQVHIPGGGVLIQIGPRPDQATIRPRGTRSGVALLRRNQFVPIGNDPLALVDGDMVIDAKTEAPIVKVHLTSCLSALSPRRTA